MDASFVKPGYVRSGNSPCPGDGPIIFCCGMDDKAFVCREYNGRPTWFEAIVDGWRLVSEFEAFKLNRYENGLL